MKRPYQLFGVALLLLNACADPHEKLPTTQGANPPPPPAGRPPETPTACVRTFLTWYEQHQEQLNSLPVVPAAVDNDTTRVYAVDFQAVDRYLRLLQSCPSVSPVYVQAHRRFFRQFKDSLRAHPQTDGTVIGLDYDRVLFTQAGETQTQFVLRSQPTRVTVGADTAQVLYQWKEAEVSDGRNLAFSLARQQDQWLITAIRPVE